MTADGIAVRFRLDRGSFCLAAELTLPGRGITVLLGPSGSGKTTLLRCMAGLERAPSGFFGINGAVWQDSERCLFVPTHRRNLGYVFQEANLFPHLSVAQNLRFGLKRIKPASDADARLKAVIDLFGIGYLLDRPPEGLSGGEQQRVAVARALALKPDLLLMDEPLASLDLKRKQEIMPFLLALQREFGTPIVYVTHSPHEAAYLADRLVLLDDGRVGAAGSASDLLARLDLPFAGEKQAAVVWRTVIMAHEPEFRLTLVKFDSGVLSLPMLELPPGASVRVQIRAQDVSLALQPPTHTSIINILPAVITGIADDEDGHTVVQLRVGGAVLLAHVTRKSARLLDLQAGLRVFAQIKGTSILS